MAIFENDILSEKTLKVFTKIFKSENADQTDHRSLTTKIRSSDVAKVTRQLSTLLKAGMPLISALTALSEQHHDQPFGKIMDTIKTRVNQGSSLAGAMQEYQNIFSNVYIKMVWAGEAGGTLEHVLSKLADMLEKRTELSGKIKSAMAYPLLMTIVSLCVVIFLLSYVVPSITEILFEMERELPLPTRILINISNFIKSYFTALLVLVFLVIAAIRVWLKNSESRLLWDKYKLRLPFFGKLTLKAETARFSRTLAMLLTSGLGILESLDIVKGVVQNSFVSKTVGQIKNHISRGDNLAESIKRSKIFSPIVFHIVSTGQSSGNIEPALIDIAEIYERDVETTTKTLTTLIEPCILLIMGVVVGFIVTAILLPIFEINQGI